MTLGIMQPYIFPYIGYYQLISSVDKLVMYDDVNFIKQGWINRNRILLNNKDYLFTIPIKNISSNTLINETLIDQSKYNLWKKKFLKTLVQAYKRAPYFEEAFCVIRRVLDAEYSNISQVAFSSLEITCHYIGIDTLLIPSSGIYDNNSLNAQQRVINICQIEKAIVYINPVGGQSLYSKEEFQKNGIKLNFLQSNSISYTQYKNDFVPWLSIIDVIMFNTKETVRYFVNQYKIV